MGYVYHRMLAYTNSRVQNVSGPQVTYSQPGHKSQSLSSLVQQVTDVGVPLWPDPCLVEVWGIPTAVLSKGTPTRWLQEWQNDRQQVLGESRCLRWELRKGTPRTSCRCILEGVVLNRRVLRDWSGSRWSISFPECTNPVWAYLLQDQNSSRHGRS